MFLAALPSACTALGSDTFVLSTTTSLPSPAAWSRSVPSWLCDQRTPLQTCALLGCRHETQPSDDLKGCTLLFANMPVRDRPQQQDQDELRHLEPLA